MRYQVGQTIPVIGISYSHRVGPHSFHPYYPWHRAGGKPSLHFAELTVMEHHKVPDEWDRSVNNCDGFILQDESGAKWHNQYPYASCGQTSTESDQRFALHVDGFVGDKFDAWCDANPDLVWEMKDLSSYIAEVKRGLVDRAAYKDIPEDEKEQWAVDSAMLQSHLDEVIASFEKFSGKKVIVGPRFLKLKDGGTRELAGWFSVTFEDA